VSEDKGTFFSQASSIDWMTPPEIVQATREVFSGEIDLDPCPSVDPKNWFAAENWSLGSPVDSLLHHWKVRGNPAKVFVNPPFGTSYLRDGVCISSKQYTDLPDAQMELWKKRTLLQWAKKCIEEYSYGCEIVWLSKTATENRALQEILGSSSAICFPDYRVKYIDPKTMEQQRQPTFGSLIAYLGNRPGVFASRFSSLGVCRVLV
jgi:hypothetical protein